MLKCAFINCHDLFQPGTVDRRGPQTPEEMKAKLGALAETLRRAVGGIPDLVGLCEVGDEAVGKELAEAIATGYYTSVWSGRPQRKNSMGLMVLYRCGMFKKQREWSEPQSLTLRTRAMAVLLGHVTDPTEPPKSMVWFVVSHWEATFSDTAVEDRRESWSNFSRFCRKDAFEDTDALILVGDFNCEPWGPPFVNKARDVLEATRERRLVLEAKRGDSFLYNPMWRLAVEAAPYEDTLAAGYSERFHRLGTWVGAGKGWRMIDQLIVTRALLAGPFLKLQEATVSIVIAHLGCSDHCAIGASFTVEG